MEIKDNDTVAVDDIPMLKFCPIQHDNGTPYGTFEFEVNDGTAYSAQKYTITINVQAVNDLPFSTDKSIALNEDTVFTFAESHFVFQDNDPADQLSKIRLRIPDDGQLWVDTDGDNNINGAEAALLDNSEVVLANIENMKYKPAEHWHGDTSFEFTIHDGTAFSGASNTIFISVAAVNDLPTAENVTLTATEDAAYTLKMIDFAYADVEGEAFLKVRLQPVKPNGILWFDENLDKVRNEGELVITPATKSWLTTSKN